MDQYEKLDKSMRRLHSALRFSKLLYKEFYDDDLSYAIGYMEKALDKLSIIDYKFHNDEEAVKQMEFDFDYEEDI